MQAAKKLTDTAVQYYAYNYFEYKFSFSKYFKRSVDLPKKKAMKIPYTRQAFTKQKITRA